ncbi:hypothetical protein E2I00_012565 [Balaenoptera physalus]|uniref:Uncharacterized protein n=1 Tax=Balaenoptera physalus TaxID=9770 RepID=A0A6A1QDJ6_BALPH|nr:hypothetical protein E2I00_012565 [Balaenoptera physalus]
METILLKKMCEIIGWRETEADGIFSPGGSISNLYGILVAHYKQYPEIKTKGMTALPCIVLFVSEQVRSLFSKKKLQQSLVWELITGKMIPAELEKNILQAKSKGQTPFYVTATAGSTVFGAFYPLHDIADICEMHKLWMHVDELGEVACCCPETTPINSVALKGETPAIACATCNQMQTGYLFQPDKLYNVDFDTGHKSIQCGRHVDIFKLWLTWKDVEQYLLVKFPFNDICIYTQIAPKIKAQMIEEGTGMLNYQPYGDKVNFFRMVFSNPATRQTDVDYVIDEIQRLGKDL